MSPNYKARKVNKKQRRCETIIEKECNIKSCDQPTRFLAILNAGCTTGLTEENLFLELFQYGSVLQTSMLPGKSYCFIECLTVSDAESIFCKAHNHSTIGQNNAVIFLSYFDKLPNSVVDVWKKERPKGLYVLRNFITEEEEASILQAVSIDENSESEATGTHSTLKNRRVKHFGYEFIYGINRCDLNRPLKQKIPTTCDALWSRLKSELKIQDYDLKSFDIPDQLTVNFYEPGQGIPPHVDTHSAFLDPIFSLSLQGETVMEFRRGMDKIPVLLPARSMLMMSGESRYDWTHGITPRTHDVVPSSAGALTTQRRSKRISLTFRKLRSTACDCIFPALCDTRLEAISTKRERTDLEEIATSLEKMNVHEVYDHIASHFSETRHTPWPQVADFLNSFPCGSLLIDIGCGNGKYLQCSKQSLTIGCDRSQGLLEISGKRGNNVFRCDCLAVPIRSESADGCFSIAVIHHLATVERRLQALREMARILRKNGRALVYVWAKEQRKDTKRSSYLLQNKAILKKKSTEDEQRQKLMRETESMGAYGILPIHTNRTNFQHQDVLVPWKLKDTKAENENSVKNTFLRYYHVFEENELEEMLNKVPEIRILKSYYDQGNHCCIFEKI